MSTQKSIKQAQERFRDLMLARPSQARVTRSVTAEVTGGLQITLSDGEFTVVSDDPEALGGTNTGPTPGTIARLGLAACIAGGYAINFATRDIPYERLSVELFSDIDFLSFFGVEGSTVGYFNMRYVVNLESSADRESIMAAMDDADANSPVLNSFRNPVQVDRELRLNERDCAAAE